jgi:hypothetical protein
MKLTTTIIFLICTLSLNAQITKYVNAKNGLLVRAQPNKESERTGKLDLATKVKILKETGIPLSIKDNDSIINGEWVFIKDTRTNNVGYVFNGYLTTTNPSEIIEKSPIKGEDYYLITKKRFGLINAQTKKSNLKYLFDKSQIKDKIIDSYEGFDVVGTEISFRNSNDNFTIQWHDNTLTPYIIKTNYQNSHWRIKDDIKVESTLKEVQNKNEKVFSLNNFEVDAYLAGVVSNWNYGALEGFQIQFEITKELSSKEYLVIMNSDLFSDNKTLQKANLTVKQISIHFPLPDCEEFSVFIKMLNKAIDDRDSTFINNRIASDFYYSRDFGDMFNPKASPKINFSKAFQLDNTKLRKGSFDYGWLRLKGIINSNGFEKSESDEFCTIVTVIEEDDYTSISDALCFKLDENGKYIIAGYIGGGD